MAARTDIADHYAHLAPMRDYGPIFLSIGESMRGQLSYADAVKLLGGTDSVIVTALDRLTGGVLLAATGGGSEFALSLFDAKGELARLSSELVSGLTQRFRGLGRYDLSQRLTAAHSVLILTAYFEALRDVKLPFDIKELKMDRAEQVAVPLGDAPPSSRRIRHLVDILNDRRLDAYTPSALRHLYEDFGRRITHFIMGLGVWDQLSATKIAGFNDSLNARVPNVAARLYEGHLVHLAKEFPEVAFWVNRRELADFRLQFSEWKVSLEGLGEALTRISTRLPPDERREALARRYYRALERPIISSGDVPQGVVIPTLASAYINPSYRVVTVSTTASFDEEEWWQPKPVQNDIQEFLMGHLTSIKATECPLLVLGQPGSGKSVLTRVLAARLPVSDFMVVRVALREVPADSDLQTQIEVAIRDATGERVDWPELARSAKGAIPVILLDGFDELLQATGFGRNDYLEQIARFQEREADQERPVAVVVTSRTAVAGHVRVPITGLIVLKIEPFDDSRVESWLDIWNECNAEYLNQKNLLPLSSRTALRQAHLATQPLLLLMLSLYDIEDNALEKNSAGIDEADLYERIFLRFAKREVEKTHSHLSQDALNAAIEDELLRLSITAFSMFIRGRQWVTEEELTKDLSTLIQSSTGGIESNKVVGRLTPAQLVVGRFFFIHQSQAILDDQQLTTCEFLHAMFGEYLIARLVVSELDDLALSASARRRHALDDSFLSALLSFAPLTIRATVIGFLRRLISVVPRHRLDMYREILFEMLQETNLRTSWGPTGFGPELVAVPIRSAAHSANIVTLTVMTTRKVTGSELFPRTASPVAEWRRHALLWRSQLTAEGWSSVASVLRVKRIWPGTRADIIVTFGDSKTPHSSNLLWASDGRWGESSHGFRRLDSEVLRRESFIACDPSEDAVWEIIGALFDRLGDYYSDESSLRQKHSFSLVKAFANLWLASSSSCAEYELVEAYIDSLKAIKDEYSIPDHERYVIEEEAPYAPSADADMEEPVISQLYLRVMRQLSADHDRISPEHIDTILQHFPRAAIERGVGR